MFIWASLRKKKIAFLSFKAIWVSSCLKLSKLLGALPNISKAFSATLNMRKLFFFLNRWASEKITPFQNLRRPVNTCKFTAGLANTEIPSDCSKNSALLLLSFDAFSAYKLLNLPAYIWEDSVDSFCQHCSFLAISLSQSFCSITIAITDFPSLNLHRWWYDMCPTRQYKQLFNYQAS